MEKPVNKFKMNKYFLLLSCLFCFLLNQSITSQYNIERYNIGNITVTGNTSFSPLTIITFSGLKKGAAIDIPGEKLSSAVKKLWKSNLFSSVNIFRTNVKDGVIDLEIELFDLPELNELKVECIKKRKIEELIKENKLQVGVKVTENLITTTKNYANKNIT